MKNRITDILGTRYPLILGPMRMMTLGEMAAGVSNSGGFGQIAASGASADLLAAEIQKAKRLTDKPFGLNMPIYRPNAFEALEIAIEAGIKTVTTSAGNPAKMIGRIKEAGLKVLHKVSSLKMALKARDAGVDAVIATGYEAGGHVGRDTVTTLCLIPQLVDALDIPVVAAGGIGDGRAVAAAFALGAEGVEVGTRFVCTVECTTPDWYKQSIINASDGATLVLGGEAMPIRVLKNKKALEVLNPEKAAEDDRIRSGGDDAYVDGDAQEAIMPAGQVAALICDIKTIADIFPEMVREAAMAARRLDRFFRMDDTEDAT
ncbi:MAG: nitronate monooxygenase [Desulfobacterales bacterium]